MYTLNKYLILASAILFNLFSCKQESVLVELESGMLIKESTSFQKDTLYFLGNDSLDQPILVVEGDDIVLDFNNILLQGNKKIDLPNHFKGTAILVQNSKNVAIRNLNVKAYKVAIMAINVDSLLIENCDLSYNYRQRLRSTREEEHLDDWLYYHNNEEREWLRYGAAIYLEDCDYAAVRNMTITGGQNGVMMVNCNKGLFYNNTIQFNSGIGIGLYRSSHNQIMHNRLDWNVRGYSHGFYSKGQDSAGILCYEQSNENIFAYNSATHSGNGFYLWAGQTTMDTGEGGCNDNIIYSNDFSHASVNGVEATFSHNIIANNIIKECSYAIWGGYSYNTNIIGNQIEKCEHGIAIEHGQGNSIFYNLISDGVQGIQLWERTEQPTDWGYVQAKDISSKDYNIGHNAFWQVDLPLAISNSSKLAINDANIFARFRKLLSAEAPNTALVMAKNDIYGLQFWGDGEAYKPFNHILATDDVSLEFLKKNSINLANFSDIQPPPKKDGINTRLPEGQLKGRKYILIDEWGPYDFKRPGMWLRNQSEGKYTFLLLGPVGNWKLTGGGGFKRVTPKTGTFPATVVVETDTDSIPLSIEMEFIGEAITTQFGEQLPRGSGFKFGFKN
ncbi:MAG: right-handed parallel beta-helix repeat-containing protein [Chitinophagales bacterium]|nr:right-handed parallel beta-helix repeat-containing protein [Chitinophagales bacterium]